jgi:hypothetical protein
MEESKLKAIENSKDKLRVFKLRKRYFKNNKSSKDSLKFLITTIIIVIIEQLYFIVKNATRFQMISLLDKIYLL